MRDTKLLGVRLYAAIACLPLSLSGAALVGCGPGAADGGGRPPHKKGKPVPAAADAPRKSVYLIDEGRPFGETGDKLAVRWGNDPIDPDGEEEQGCPNGDWCAPAGLARKFAIPDMEEVDGCPTRLRGTPEPPVSPKDPAVEGLSLSPVMLGRLYRIATAEAREASGEADTCCYHWYEYCSGRPLLNARGEGLRAAFHGAVSTWLAGRGGGQALGGELPLAARARVAAAWVEDARAEHASVASFARTALEMLAVGAPAGLVAACRQAAADEVRHARICLELARQYGAVALEPGPLPAVAPRPGGHAALALSAFVEGCVGETIAALTADRAARACAIEPVAAALAGIAEDETRHAALAWATVAHGLDRAGPRRPALVAALRERAANLSRIQDSSPGEGEAALVAHGRLGAAGLARARRDAWRELISPTLEALIEGSAAGARA